MNLIKVEKCFDKSLTTLNMGEFTLEKRCVSVVIVGSLSVTGLMSLNTTEFRLEKSQYMWETFQPKVYSH